MHPALDTADRLGRLVGAVETLGAAVSDSARAAVLFQGTLERMRVAADAYTSAASGGSPRHFIEQVSIAVRKLRRAISGLVLLVQLDYLPIEQARDPIIEARDLERLLTRTRDAARRRHVRSRRSAVGSEHSAITNRQ
jgi:hypothetical protein